MFRNKKIWILFTGVVVLVFALGISAFTLPGISGDQPEGETHKGFPGKPGRGTDQTYLAEALGISVEELVAAKKAANDKALDLAVLEGLLTQEQADAMKTLGLGFHRFPPMIRDRFDENMDVSEKIDLEALLAQELGITVDELNEAQEAAKEAGFQNAVEQGVITEDQANLMQAHQALLDYRINPDEILSQVLGISTEELQSAREDGLRMKELLEKYDATFEDIQAAMQSAYEQSIQDALSDGAITQEQADLLLENEFQMMPGKHGRPHGNFKGRGEKPFGEEPFGGQGGFPKPGGFGGTTNPNSISNSL